MRYHLFRAGTVALCVLSVEAARADVFNMPAGQTSLELVTVGDPGNHPGSDGRGSVGYVYQIGKYEVTNAQYAGFLNAVDPTGSNLFALHHPQMESDMGGIARDTAAPASTRYSVKAGFANKPVNYVSFYDAMRFTNWLNDGQGAADTETGAYDLLGGTVQPTNWATVTRNASAQFAVVSEDEWRKAAYYQPASLGGDVDGYWQYPTRTNAQPNSDAPPGDPSVRHNAANFFRDDGIANGVNDGYAVGFPTFLTDVGAYSDSSSYYGTFDQAGNVFEWTDTLDGPGWRIDLSGWYGGDASFFASSYRGNPFPNVEVSGGGFRIVQVPEPASMLMLVGCGACLLNKRRGAGSQPRRA